MLYLYAATTLVGCLLGLKFKLGILLVAVVLCLLLTPALAYYDKLGVLQTLAVGILLQTTIQFGYFLGMLLRTKFRIELWRAPRI